MVPALVLSLTRASEVLIVPSYQHPFEKKLTAFDHRVALCKLAFGAYTDQVKVSTIEEDLVASGQGTKTIEVLRVLRAQNPGHELRLVIGTDILQERHRWTQFDAIEREFPPIVVGRSGFPAPDRPDVLPYLPDVRSRAIRSALSTKSEGSSMLPLSVLDYIEEHSLYP